MISTLGLIGSGMVGGSLARLALAANIDVVLSNSRGPESLVPLVAELGEHARAATPDEAARAGDIVVATIPLNAYAKLPATALSGKTVIDTMNYYLGRDDHIPELDSNELTSSGLVQRHLADSRVVKAANNIVFVHLLNLARPAGAPDRSALPIAGDNQRAKSEVAEFFDAVGYDTVDIGVLADSWRTEPDTPVYCKPYMPPVPQGLDPVATQRWIFDSPGRSAPASVIKKLVDSAVRGTAGGSITSFK